MSLKIKEQYREAGLTKEACAVQHAEAIGSNAVHEDNGAGVFLARYEPTMNGGA